MASKASPCQIAFPRDFVLDHRHDIFYCVLLSALTIVPVASLLAAVLYIIASFFYQTDLAKVEKLEMHAD